MSKSIIAQVALVYLTDARYVQSLLQINPEVVLNASTDAEKTVKSAVHFKNEKLGVNLKFTLVHQVAIELSAKDHKCCARIVGPEDAMRLFSLELDAESNLIEGMDKAQSEQFILENVELPSKFDFRVMDAALSHVLNRA